MSFNRYLAYISILTAFVVIISNITSAADTTITTTNKLKTYAEGIIKEQIGYKTFNIIDYEESKEQTTIMKINIKIDERTFTWYTTKNNFDKITK